MLRCGSLRQVVASVQPSCTQFPWIKTCHRCGRSSGGAGALHLDSEAGAGRHLLQQAAAGSAAAARRRRACAAAYLCPPNSALSELLAAAVILTS